MHIANFWLETFFVFQLHVSPSLARRTMEAQEWVGSATPLGHHSTGPQGSPVGRRSRQADVYRELRATDH